MGNQLAVGGSLQELHLQDLAEGIVQEKTLGGGRLLKSVQCWTEDGMPVVVKVYLKKEDDPSLALQPHHEKLKLLCEKLSLKNQPNVLSYHRMVETDKAGYLVRQYCYSNLADRISTRPFFSQLSKKWIAYQILSGLHQIKQAGLSHGDIKAENIVLTGWDWVFLTDLAPFKPVVLPADDPSNFAYFFDTAERRICLIAPERFSSQSLGTPTSLSSETYRHGPSTPQSAPTVTTLNQQQQHVVTEQMDIFSVGCVLAQLFLEGEALFDLSQLLAYRKGDMEHLNASLNRIDDPHMREMIAHMLQLDPEKRYSAKQYLEKYTPTVFPEYFKWVHEQILSQLVVKNCDERIMNIASNFDTLVEIFRDGILPDSRMSSSNQANSKNIESNSQRKQITMDSTSEKKMEISDLPDMSLESATDGGSDDSEYNIEERASQFKKQIEAIRNKDSNSSQQREHLEQYKNRTDELIKKRKDATVDRRITPDSSKLISNNYRHPTQTITTNNNNHEGTEIIASLLCSSVRNARNMSSRVKGLFLIQRLSDFSSNYTRLQRLVPYTCVMLSDSSPLVKATAIRTLTYILSKITKFPASETNLFSDYILPALRTLATDASVMVRVVFAEHFPLLAYEARRFLEMGELIKQASLRINATNNASSISDNDVISGTASSQTNALLNSPVSSQLIKGTYDTDLHSLQEEICSLLLTLSMDECSSVKRALLKNIIHLCIFYGRRRTDEFVLPMVITFLNCREWRLRHAFFEEIVAISVFVGPTSLKEFILPCIMQALYDYEECVIEQALNSFVALCELGMFDKRTLIQLATKISPLLHHPNPWIRFDAVAFFAAASKQLGLADTNCFLFDILKPHMQHELYVVSENSLLDAIKAPIARHIFDKVLTSPIANFSNEEESDSVARWKHVLNIPEISVEDAEKLDLMKPYIDQTARCMQSKLSEMNNLDGSTGVTEPGIESIIKLPSLPLRTHFIAVENPFATNTQSLQQQSQLSNKSSMKNEPSKTFNNDWNTIFNTQNPKKIVQRNAESNLSTNSTGSNTSVPIPVSVNTLKSASSSANLQSGTGLVVSPNSSVSTVSGGSGSGSSGAISSNTSTTSSSVVSYHASLSKKDLSRFRPVGQICAQSHEHKGSINELAVHDSLSWFVSGGNDGTVKLWDLKQAEKDYSMTSSLTCLLPNSGKVITCAILNMSSPLIASGTNKGWLNLFHASVGTTVCSILITEEGIEFNSTNTMLGNSMSSSIRSAQASSAPSVNVIRPFTINNTPLLMVGNQSGMILGIDPRMLREAFIWKSKESIQQGPITAICGEESWMATGTRRGFLTLWDLRFQISVSTSRISNTAINRMGVYRPPHSHHYDNTAAYISSGSASSSSSSASVGGMSPSIYVASGTRDIKLWSLESRQVSVVYRCCDRRQTNNVATAAASTPTNMVRSRSHSNRTVTTNQATIPSVNTLQRRVSAPSIKDPFAVKELERINWNRDEQTGSIPFEVKALYVNPDGNFMSGSSDCQIRFWDANQPAQSYIISGLENTESSTYSVQSDIPICTNNSHPTGAPVSVNTTIVTETIQDMLAQAANTSGSTGSSQQPANITRRGGAFAAPIATRHVDTVTDIKLVGTHMPLLLSSSRDGVLKMWM
jgi:phosphoinositide-3-kinase regulatory subunit 4